MTTRTLSTAPNPITTTRTFDREVAGWRVTDLDGGECFAWRVDHGVTMEAFGVVETDEWGTCFVPATWRYIAGPADACGHSYTYPTAWATA